ncbi:DNA polymerase III subunit alpha [Kineosporia sp. J2-2]|uniref:DNA polymerase III subunit alpha n=1 Tax=Kineosporia corallincola TaxID=2835133 RepID=A0ABS5TLM8_9ACTN|nr:DNA polymerase III subunit alpha [Kineosporia corallincola]MBT0771071.1 DNA polymerase III subunit alpha [Kineosporia corallincola]
MPHSFTHLHVASGYSLRYGASDPQQLVEQAVAQGLTSLALTDRDGLYGTIKFVHACRRAGITPAVGVNLAVEKVLSPDGRRRGPIVRTVRDLPEPARRVPVRGGASVDPRLPRVTVLALASGPGSGLQPGQGWGRLCRLVTATQLRGERSRPVGTVDLIAEHAQLDGTPALTVLLGPDSEYGRAVLAGRADLALAVLEHWRGLLPPACLAVEIVHHRGPQGAPASLGHAARMLNLARRAGVPVVLTNAVRHATRDGAVTVDVLDAARRLVAIDSRHLDRTTNEGYLAGDAEMTLRAHEIAEAAGDLGAAGQMLRLTASLASRCLMNAENELQLGRAHLPEPEVLGLGDKDGDAELEQRCRAQVHVRYPRAGRHERERIEQRLKEELGLVRFLGIPIYFLTIAIVCDLIRRMGVRVAARGSGAGSLINYLLGISGVDPLRHDLLMERFVTRLRTQLPDVDLDVESHRRTEVYEKLLDVFGGDRVSCVSMMDTYRARHAIRDVGGALGMPPGEIDTIAKAFPHIRARDVRSAIAELPELRASGLGHPRLGLLFDLVERLDGLPRHIALHPCGVLISDGGLLDRTPVEASWMGFPMSQFDKDDVESLGLLKLDLLGIRMQSAMSYAIGEVARVDGPEAAAAGHHDPAADYLDGTGLIDLDAVPHDDPATFSLIQSTRTLGCFQIESPGQRELVGKFAPETFHDLIIDISLFRPGPVKSDMVTPFLRARQRWDEPEYLHPALRPVLEDTCGVVVFHEQVLQIVSIATGCDLAEADEFRRAMGVSARQESNEKWFRQHAARCRTTDGERVFDADAIDRIWAVLKAFASFGFCKAHAAAFALPTYQSAWLKAHHPAAFIAGVLTHDPGMYPKRLILDDARNFGIRVLPLDVNRSDSTYRVERLTPEPENPENPENPETEYVSLCAEHACSASGSGSAPTAIPDPTKAMIAQPLSAEPAARPTPAVHQPVLPDGSGYGIRLALAEVKGISEAEVQRIVANRPYQSLADFWHRAQTSRPVVERLVITGAFDAIYGLSDALPVQSRGRTTRRDLLLQLADLERWSRSLENGRPRRRGIRNSRTPDAMTAGPRAGSTADREGTGWGEDSSGVRGAAGRQARSAAPVVAAADQSVQLALDLGDAPDRIVPSGLPEMTGAERTRAELEVLGLDASRHVLEFYEPMLTALAVTRARDVRGRRSRAEILVAGVKVATQTPPIRTGRRVVFLTLDDSTGPVDATFFEDVQGPYAGTVFHSWLLVVRGVLRKTGRRGVSLRATGAWELPVLWEAWTESGLTGVLEILHADEPPARRPLPSGLPAAAFHAGVVPADVGGQTPGRVLGTSRDDGALPGAETTDWETPTGLPSGDRGSSGLPVPGTPGRDHRGRQGDGAHPGSLLPNAAGTSHPQDPDRPEDPAPSTLTRRVLVHPSGYRQSPYADLRPPGGDTRETRRMQETAGQEHRRREEERRRQPPRKLWHSSPGSSGQ